MPAVVASRPRDTKSRNRDSAPPAKKAKLTQSPASTRSAGFKALVNGSSTEKPTAKINGGKQSRKDRVSEATAVVRGGQGGHGDVDMEDAADEEVEVELSSAEEESEGPSEDDEVAPAVNGHAEEEDGIAQDETVEPEELSFGDRLRAQDPEPVQESRIVDVESAFTGPSDEARALETTARSRPLAAPNASSLGTVLAQALRTNDVDLLDSCLRVVDVDTIYATIERLPSPLVGKLLQKLAERLHKKPGRAGMLMVWVQWSLAAHGGYLASQPQLVKQLATLNKVLKERASGLQPLLSLKGRLDMLQAQLELRRRNQRRVANDDEDEAVIYVEGEDDFISSDDEEDEDIDNAATGSQKRTRQDVDDDDDESSLDEMPTTMEVDEDSEEGSDDSDNLLDDEAEETDDDVGDDRSEPMSDDLDDGEGLSESEEESKPARRSTAARAGLKGRR